MSHSAHRDGYRAGEPGRAFGFCGGAEGSAQNERVDGMEVNAGRSSSGDATNGCTEVGRRKARRAAAVSIVLCLLGSLLTAVAPQAAAEECVPGENGCLPTRAQCATGDYNGYWDGGSPGRFAICLAYEGQIVAYAGGTASLPPCGEVVVGGQVVADGQGDPNPCGSPSGDTRLSDDPLADAAMKAGLDWCSNDVDPDSPSQPVSFPSAPEVKYTTCVGEIASFDGVEIDAKLTWPQGAAGPLPVVTLLHGWSGERRGYQDPNDDPNGWSWARFLSRGYATLAITARGFWASCGLTDQVSDVDEIEIVTGTAYEMTGGTVNAVAVGSGGTKVTEEDDPAQCVEGYTHIAERGYEVRDTQHLLGVLVDAGIADADRLAVTGASYGGGQSWLLATGGSWETPARRTIQIAASVPIVSWTDLSDALLPNGRVSDEAADPAQGPVGVLKASTFNNLFRTGRVKVPVAETWGTYIGAEPGRYNTIKPRELHSFIDGWAAVWNAGEPYGSAAHEIRDALQGKSAMYAHDYLAKVAAREVEPTPVFALQGWTDPIFPAVQAIQMYQRMKAIHPGYPVSVALGNFGHVTDPSQDQLAVAYDLAGRFVDAHLLADGEGAPEATVYSFDVTCGAGSTEAMSGRWEELTRARLILPGSNEASISSATTDAAAGLATDPVAVGAAGGSNSCLRHDSPTEGAARWSWKVDGPEEMLGLPEVAVDYSLAGDDATLIAKLWDVSEQQRVLVTRGVYRISTAHGDPQAGNLSFKLFGSHWTFAPGHSIELELSQTDAPYLRPNNLPSSIEIRDLVLEIPRPGGWGSGGRPGHGPASP